VFIGSGARGHCAVASAHSLSALAASRDIATAKARTGYPQCGAGVAIGVVEWSNEGAPRERGVCFFMMRREISD
jgi:hypothetical protein